MKRFCIIWSAQVRRLKPVSITFTNPDLRTPNIPPEASQPPLSLTYYRHFLPWNWPIWKILDISTKYQPSAASDWRGSSDWGLDMTVLNENCWDAGQMDLGLDDDWWQQQQVGVGGCRLDHSDGSRNAQDNAGKHQDNRSVSSPLLCHHFLSLSPLPPTESKRVPLGPTRSNRVPPRPTKFQQVPSNPGRYIRSLLSINKNVLYIKYDFLI